MLFVSSYACCFLKQKKRCVVVPPQAVFFSPPALGSSLPCIAVRDEMCAVCMCVRGVCVIFKMCASRFFSAFSVSSPSPNRIGSYENSVDGMAKKNVFSSYLSPFCSAAVICVCFLCGASSRRAFLLFCRSFSRPKNNKQTTTIVSLANAQQCLKKTFHFSLFFWCAQLS